MQIGCRPAMIADEQAGAVQESSVTPATGRLPLNRNSAALANEDFGGVRREIEFYDHGMSCDQNLVFDSLHPDEMFLAVHRGERLGEKWAGDRLDGSVGGGVVIKAEAGAAGGSEQVGAGGDQKPVSCGIAGHGHQRAAVERHFAVEAAVGNQFANSAFGDVVFKESAGLISAQEIEAAVKRGDQIGRASCRERVEIW